MHGFGPQALRARCLGHLWDTFTLVLSCTVARYGVDKRGKYGLKWAINQGGAEINRAISHRVQASGECPVVVGPLPSLSPLGTVMVMCLHSFLERVNGFPLPFPFSHFHLISTNVHGLFHTDGSIDNLLSAAVHTDPRCVVNGPHARGCGTRR